jgi:hypothetical protein
MMPALRWETYFRQYGADLAQFLAKSLNSKDRKIRFILGSGFDPRMLSGIRLIKEYCPAAQIEVDLLCFEEGQKSPSHEYKALAEANVAAFKKLTEDCVVKERTIAMYSPENRRITARSAEGLYKRPVEFADVTDIIVDVSALPRSVFLPVVAKLLHICDHADSVGKNLLVLANENAELDSVIIEEGIDEEADYVHPFRGDAEREATASKPRVWFPLLGENQGVQLKRVYELVRPEEICPLLPAPSSDPRRGDNLVLEHRSFLFDELRVDPRNFLYAAESNPFEVYRQLMKAIHHYADTLKPLGGANAILTVLSSKLISVGAILAAYELKVQKSRIAIAHIEAHGYRISVPDVALADIATRGVMHGMWLTGECYAS